MYALQMSALPTESTCSILTNHCTFIVSILLELQHIFLYTYGPHSVVNSLMDFYSLYTCGCNMSR